MTSSPATAVALYTPRAQHSSREFATRVHAFVAHYATAESDLDGVLRLAVQNLSRAADAFGHSAVIVARSARHFQQRLVAMPPLDDVLPPAAADACSNASATVSHVLLETRRYAAQLHRHSAAVSMGARVATASAVRRLPAGAHLSDDYINGCIDTVVCGVVVAGAVVAMRRATRRYTTVDTLPTHLVHRQARLHGTVVAAPDGDNLRFRHMPPVDRLLGRVMAPRPSQFSHATINVRLAAVDAPECAHGARPGQPYGPEARSWLHQFATGRRVSIQLHSIDQYRRAVATVHRKSVNPILRVLGLGSRNVGLELTRAGYATLYEGSGAQYGSARMLRQYTEAEKMARASRIGMWQSSSEVLLPREFKRQLRAGAAVVKATGKKAGKAGKAGKGKRSKAASVLEELEGSGTEQPALKGLLKLAQDVYDSLRKLR